VKYFWVAALTFSSSVYMEAPW